MSESRRSGSAHFTSSLLQAEAFNYISLLASSCRWYKLPQLISFFLSRCGTKAIRDSTFVRLSSEEVGRESSIDIVAIFLLFCSRAFGCEPKPNGVDI